MEQEIRRPDYVPRVNDRAASTLSCFMAAAGVTLMTLCLFGAAGAVTAWAVAQLFELGNTMMLVLQVLVAIPVLWMTIWVAGRAWYLEKRIARGQDVDVPIFKLFHYFTKSA
jgi:hypothetical protein